jgi:hypothetical protein
MMLQKYNFGNTHVSLGTRTKTKPGNQISKILNILKQLENISMNTDSPHSAGRRTPPRAAFIMSNDKLDICIVSYSAGASSSFKQRQRHF